MKFRFDEQAAVEAASYLLQKANGRLNYTVLIKLLYLADREKLRVVDAPITGATYFSLPNGPVLSEVLDLINEQPVEGGRDLWQEHIARAGEWDVTLIQPMPMGRLSRGDRHILDQVFTQFGRMSYGQIIQWCHDNLPEWKDPHGSRKPLNPDDILHAVGRSDSEIADIRMETAYLNWLDNTIESPTPGFN
jgi:uncharacterized phage-associated protein